ncbi:unnamed protein product, partial [Staurois parvus]
MVGVTSQGSGAGEWSDKPGIRAGSAENQTGTGNRNRIPGRPRMEKHTPRQSLQVWPSLKYPSVSSFRCLAGCKVEISDCWEHPLASPGTAPIRQASPTIAGQSIPDS